MSFLFNQISDSGFIFIHDSESSVKEGTGWLSRDIVIASCLSSEYDRFL